MGKNWHIGEEQRASAALVLILPCEHERVLPVLKGGFQLDFGWFGKQSQFYYFHINDLE